MAHTTVKSKKQLAALTGNEAVAYAMKQINPEVVASYPITPQTTIMEKFSEYVANGQVDTELVCVESEHSAMSAVVGAASGGVRTITATSANGLALMWEIVYVAAGLRLPIVSAVVNRALSAPINIHCDHSDTMGTRDSGWIQLYSEDAQEAYDNMLQAVRIAEHKDVQLPCMVMLDGFIISHEVEAIELYDDEKVKKFIGGYTPRTSVLKPQSPVTVGALDLFDYYFEHRRQQAEGMNKAYQVIKDIGKEFGSVFGRSYDTVAPYKTADADVVLVALSSACGTISYVVDKLRAQGKKAGMLKIRCFRPFPKKDIVDALRGKKIVGVFDRSDSLSSQGGPVASEIKAALYGETAMPVVNYIYGLGGRDMNEKLVEEIFLELFDAVEKKKQLAPLYYKGLRE